MQPFDRQVEAGFEIDFVVVTSLNAVSPDAGRGDKRSIWELDAVRIYDGGADGDGDATADNTVFARPGVFIP